MQQEKQQQWNESKNDSNLTNSRLNDEAFMMPPPSSVPLNSCTLSLTSSNSPLQEPTLKAEYVEDSSIENCVSSPAISTTSAGLVNDLLFEPKPTSSLQNYPMMEVQSSFVQVSSSSNKSSDMIQSQNFAIKTEKIQDQQEITQLTSHGNLMNDGLSQHDRVSFLNTFGQLSSENQIFHSAPGLRSNLLFSTPDQPQHQQNIHNGSTKSNQMIGQNTINQMLDSLSSSLSSQDIVLNSSSAVVLNNNTSIQKDQTGQSIIDSQSSSLSSNVILNTTISPSMMCQTDQALLAQVPMETAPILINNIIPSIPMNNVSSIQSVNNPNGIGNNLPTTPVAVKSMILDAAAEILNVNALMNTLNQNEQQSQTCMEVQTSSGNIQQQLLYSSNMPLPPPANTSESMNIISACMDHDMNIASKQAEIE